MINMKTNAASGRLIAYAMTSHFLQLASGQNHKNFNYLLKQNKIKVKINTKGHYNFFLRSPTRHNTAPGRG